MSRYLEIAKRTLAEIEEREQVARQASLISSNCGEGSPGKHTSEQEDQPERGGTEPRFLGFVGSDSVVSPIISDSTTKSANAYSPGRPSPDNANRPVAERYKESLELHGELNHLYNTRAAILEAVAGLSRVEAERLAMSEVKATESYLRWRALG